MRRTIAAATGAFALGAATLVGGQLAAPTPSAASQQAVVCQPPIGGHGYSWGSITCDYWNGAQTYFLYGDCSDGHRYYGWIVRIHEKATLTCGAGVIQAWWIASGD